MWQRCKRRWTMVGVIVILRPLRPHRPGLESPGRLPGVHRLPSPQPRHPSQSPQSSHQDPNLRPGLEESGRSVPRYMSRPRDSLRQVELPPTRRGSRGGSLVLAPPYLCDGIMQRARWLTWCLRGPADVPQLDGILVGVQAGLPVQRLRIPKVSSRGTAQRGGIARGVAGSPCSSPPEGVIRGSQSA